MINFQFSGIEIADNLDTLFSSVKELLQEKRWFTQKHKKISGITTEDYVVFEDNTLLLFAVLLTFHFEDSSENSRESFFIPYCLIPETDAACMSESAQAIKITCSDGIYYLFDGEACGRYHRFVQEAMAARRTIKTRQGFSLSFSYTHDENFKFTRTEALQQPTSNVLSIWENESEKYVLKSYRKFVCNPEPEMLGVLDEGNFANIPVLIGSVKYMRPEYTFYPAILFKYIENTGNEKSRLTGCASALFSENLKKRLEEAAKNGCDTKNGILEIEAEVKKIANVLASFHKTLAASKQPNFGTEKVSTADIEKWQQSSRDMEKQVDSILKQLREHRSKDMSRFIDFYNLASTRFEGIRSMLLKPCGIDKSRIHQDMHLDQLLMANNTFYIIDLEGEPMRSGEEKFEKVHPLRDVGGICRSLGYVKHFTLLSILSKDIEDISIGLVSAILVADAFSILSEKFEFKLFADVCNAWEKEVLSLFIKSYFTSLNITSFDECADHVGYWMLEKALYELSYEAGNRPENISIPIEGVVKICSLFKNNKFELL